jgi:tetratricopeptide (TPR) repeat protein
MPRDMSRLESIRKIVEQQPNDPFARYGLAMELKNLGQHDAAHAEFEELEKRHPAYVPQFLMHANLLTELKRTDEAKACLERGIAAAKKSGNQHALGEMQGALDQLENR